MAMFQPAAEAFTSPQVVGTTRARRASWRTGGAAPRITATILTKNSALRLEEVLRALRWCDEVLIYDTGSTDQTAEIARRAVNASFHRMTGEFPGFGLARQAAVALARNDWILSIDSDEVVSRELAEEIMALSLDPQAVYDMPFHNFFNERLITTCGWYPERHERLFNRTATTFCASHVHERVRMSGVSLRSLRHPIRHFSYESNDDFLRKMRSYSQLFADQHVGRKPSSPAKAVSRSVWAFFKSYVVERGAFQGYEGLVISAYKAQTVFWKYLLLHEANRRRA
jgi:glycosyltransferase involved in cell wall biosynthesis